MEEDSALKKQQDKKEEKKDTSSSVKWNFLTDMDGVLIKENKPVEGAEKFLKELQDNDTNYMVLTNNSIFTPRDLSARLALSLSLIHI